MTLPFATGTLKSQRTSTRLPAKFFTSLIDFIRIAILFLVYHKKALLSLQTLQRRFYGHLFPLPDDKQLNFFAGLAALNQAAQGIIGVNPDTVNRNNDVSG